MKIKNQIKNKKSLPKSESKQKHKNNSKQKSKKFNPLQYLNELIQLTNTNPLKPKKNKLPHRRNLTSALTAATPSIEPTVSTSKIRCKSSYSQYRKKSTHNNNLKEVLHVNLNNYIITEEQDSNCIKFTSISSPISSNQQTPIGQKDLSERNKILLKYRSSKLNSSQEIDFDFYARKIQRAWRSYQTYKMIFKYYRHFKKQKKYERQILQNQMKMQYTPRNHLKKSNHELKEPNRKDILPSLNVYINNSYDSPQQLYANNISEQYEDVLQRTIKFKIKNQQEIKQHENMKQKKRMEVLKRENSFSQNQLNLTQKLNQLSEQSQPKIKSNQESFEDVPTIEMKKNQFSNLQKKTRNQRYKLHDQQQNQNQDNSSTQKKKKQLQNLKMSQNKNKSQRKNKQKQSINEESYLDHSPTLKEKFSLSGQIKSPKVYQQSNSVKNTNKQASLVDSMIQKQTQKYNEILSLIQACSSKQNNSKDVILLQLLSRLQQHKSELEANNNINSKKDSIVQKEKKNPAKQSFENSPLASSQNRSFMAFESKQAHHLFEDQDFISEKKTKIRDESLNDSQTKKKSERYTKYKLQQQEREVEQNLRMLNGFSSLLKSSQKKLEQVINQSARNNMKMQTSIGLSLYSHSQSQVSLKRQSSNSISDMSFQKLQSKQTPGQYSSSPEIQEQDSIFSFCSSGYNKDRTNKLFDKHIELVNSKRQNSIQNLKQLISQDKISQSLYSQKLSQIQQKFNVQIESITKKKQNYLKTLQAVKKQAIQFQKDLVFLSKKPQGEKMNLNHSLSSSKLGVRKSFSAENMVLKSILQQPVLLNQDFPVNKLLLTESDINSQEIHDSSSKMTDQSNTSQRKMQNTERSEEQRSVRYYHKQNTVSDFQTEQLNADVEDEGQSDQCSGQVEFKNVDEARIKLHKQLNDRRNNQTIDYNHIQNQEDSAEVQSHEQSYDDFDEQKSDKFEQRPIYSNEVLQTIKSGSLEHFKESSQSSLSQQKESDADDSSYVNEDSLPIQQEGTTTVVYECSEQLQKMIEMHLIVEVLEEIYLNDSMFKIFKPFVDEIFEFTKITDQDIINFLEKKITQHFPPLKELTRKTNQKINPTSLQILRLIRDFQYQIDEYELILSQEIFKKVRKEIELEYEQKIKAKRQTPISSHDIKSFNIINRVYQREGQKRAKVQKYLTYERDMKIMYMKSVFNCLNEFLIEQKSIATHVNSRSTIGTGELSLSIKEFNVQCNEQDVKKFFNQANDRIKGLLRNKCNLPVFKNYKDVGMFQNQMMKMIKKQFEETEYKWVTYMDEVLELWNEVANQIFDDIISEAKDELNSIRTRILE